MAKNVGDAGRVVGADHFLLQPELFDQRQGFGLLRNETVGSAFDDTAIADGSLNHAAGARQPLDQRVGRARFGEVVRRGEAGDASTSDDDLIRHDRLQLEFAHDLDARLHVFDRRLRQDAVAQIEDVSGA